MRFWKVLLQLMLAVGCPTVNAQQPIRPVPLLPFADNKEWVLVDDLSYEVGTSGVVIAVPKGFVTDFASIPQALWSVGLSPNGLYSKAAVVHDYLYWTQSCSRQQADNLLMIAMKESGVNAATRRLIYEGVRLGGGSAWVSNSRERSSRLPRVIPADRMAFGALAVWADYRAELAAAGVRDPAFSSAAGYCALGETQVVPALSEPSDPESCVPK
jgi:Protein of unknown function (DUF1353)